MRLYDALGHIHTYTYMSVLRAFYYVQWQQEPHHWLCEYEVVGCLRSYTYIYIHVLYLELFATGANGARLRTIVKVLGMVLENAVETLIDGKGRGESTDTLHKYSTLQFLADY